MKWYFAYNTFTEEAQFPLIRMAVNSARRYTDLQPNCIVSGPPGACCAWLQRQGVRVHFRDARILPDFIQHKEANPGFDLVAARGAYLRLEIGEIEHEDEYVLYTDTDVMFRSLDGIDAFRPSIVAMAPEAWDPGDWDPGDKAREPNSGVMVINVPQFRGWVDRVYELAARNPSAMVNHDQTAIASVLGSRWERLDAIFNWKPYWGYSDQARIVHWHGPKPVHAQSMLIGDIDHMAQIYQFLFRLNPEGYCTYVPIAEELAMPTNWRQLLHGAINSIDDPDLGAIRDYLAQQLVKADAAVTKLQQVRAALADLTAAMSAQEEQKCRLERALSDLRGSRTWKLAAPLWRLETHGKRKADRRKRSPGTDR